MPLGNPIRKQNESRMVSVLATEGQTVFTVQGGYIINHISVFRNGVRLSPAEDFTAGDGSTVTLNDAANIEDRIDFHIFDRFTVQNAIVGAASTQTINGDLVLNGKLFGQLDVPSINLTGIVTATELDLNGKGDISGDLNVVGVSTFSSDVIINKGSDTGNIIQMTGADTTSELFEAGITSGFVQLTATYAAGGDNSAGFVVRTRNGSSGTAERIRIGANGTIEVQDSVTLSTNAPTKKGKIRISGTSDASNDGGIEFHTSSGGGGGYGSRITADASGNMHFLTRVNSASWSERFRIDTSGHIVPGTDSTYDLGLTGTRFRNLYADTLYGAVSGTTGTFSDDVTVTGSNKKFISNSTSSGDYVRVYAGGGTGKWDIYGNGTDLRFSDNDSAGVVRFDTDVSIADKIIHTGDTDTAIRFPDADTFTVETGGSERLRIKSDGKVGISTDGPFSVLTAYGENRGEGTVTGQITAKDDADYNASPTAGLVFMGKYAANNAQAIFSGITGFKENANDGNLAGALAFHVRANGAVAYEALRINSSGNLLIGHTDSRDLGGLSSQKLVIEGTSGNAAIGIINNQNSGGFASLRFSKSRGTSVGSNTIVQSGDPLGGIVFCGADGNDMTSVGAQILAEVDGTPGSNDMPARLEFFTTPDGSASPTERMRIDRDGRVMIGNDQASTQYQDGGDDLVIGNTSGAHGITVISQDNNVGRLMFSDTYSAGTGTYEGQILYSHALNTMNFYANYTSNQNIAMTIGGSNGDVTVHGGNLIIGTSGKGIDFSATGDASGSSSELLDDYEEGLWTPTFTTTSGSVSINASYDKVTYTKIGRLVHLVGQAVVGVSNPGGNLTIGGLPFTVGNYSDIAGRNFCLFMMYANGSGVPDGSSYYVIHGRMLEGNNDFLCEGVKPNADGSIADWCGNGTDFFFDITYVAAT